MITSPTAYGAVISTAVKAVLIALVAVKVLPWDDATIAAVTLAASAVFDVAIFLGLIRPRVTPTADPKTNDGIALVPDPTTVPRTLSTAQVNRG